MEYIHEVRWYWWWVIGVFLFIASIPVAMVLGNYVVNSQVVWPNKFEAGEFLAWCVGEALLFIIVLALITVVTLLVMCARKAREILQRRGVLLGDQLGYGTI